MKKKLAIDRQSLTIKFAGEIPDGGVTMRPKIDANRNRGCKSSDSRH